MRDLLRWLLGWKSSALAEAGPANLCFHDEAVTRTTFIDESIACSTLSSESISQMTLIDEVLEVC